MSKGSKVMPSQRIISSTKLVHNQQYIQGYNHTEERQDEVPQDQSMLPTNVIKTQPKDQDEWFANKKYNPLELPL
jgi:hypothetical protein